MSAKPEPTELEAWLQSEVERIAAERESYRIALGVVLKASLLRIRAAAFSPQIGVRYTEAIRAEIAEQCWHLENYVKDVLRG